jgi:superfamily II DNA or RNA helicase
VSAELVPVREVTGRFFTRSQRVALYLAAGGRCQDCGRRLKVGWHADHKLAHSRGGRTELSNGQALCADCNHRKGIRLMDSISLRPKQRDVADILVERVRGQDREPVVALLAPGFGKELAWQNAAVELLRADLIDAVMVFTPRTNLCTQAETNWWHRDSDGRDHGRRLLYANPVAHSFTWPKGNRVPLYESPACGYVTTYQALVTNPSAHLDFAAEHSGRAMIVVDEAAFLGSSGVGENDVREATQAAQRIRELYPHAACVLYLTGTPHRGDGRRLILLEHRYRQRDDGTWALQHDVLGTYTEGVGAGYLRPAEITYVNAEGREVLPDGQERAVSVAGDPAAVYSALLSENVYRSMARHTVDRLRGVRTKHPGLMAGIACMNQDHAGDVLEFVREHAPELRSDIAVSKDGSRARAVLDRARAGQLDVLVFVRQAFIGFDCPHMTVLGILTNYRNDAFLMQLAGRALRVWDQLPVGEQWAHFVTLNDPAAVAFFERLRTDGVVGLREREPGGDPPPEGNGRDLRDFRETAVHVDDAGGLVEGGAEALALMERYRLGGTVRDVAAFIRDVRDGKTGNTSGNGDVGDEQSLPTTNRERIEAYLSRAEKNAQKIAGKRVREDGRSYGEVIADVKSAISRRSYWSDDCTTEDKARARYEASVAMCEQEGIVNVHERPH